MEELARMLEGNDDEKWLALYKMQNIDFESLKPYIPKVIEILKEKKLTRRIAFDLLLKISQEKPEVLLDYVEDFKNLVGNDFESVYASIILGKLSLRYPEVVDSETVSRIANLLESDDMKSYALLALSDIAISKPNALSSLIPKLIELIKDRNWEVRWNAAKVFLNMISNDSRIVEPYLDDIRKVAENEKLKPSIRVVAHVILNEFETFRS
ncbi:HEAT repeat domain-containing protein [Archaeoglobus profundus]|uniref:HEAT domain containing protein n=1 Tax=Archaeoglobus profundus (strain DSM 5631 / JCM 9629 / NBRC 100127 / Av18) TaxID=572546 RepID=D2REH2_ARCPA|nr:HEAT repeat domain-containing protein [Archaeoglobus profundus]ADB58516.1 HEAT domain containing protein [Archaeoglobus profundus DSM 5631]